MNRARQDQQTRFPQEGGRRRRRPPAAHDAGRALRRRRRARSTGGCRPMPAPALAEHVIKPSIDAFNKAANGEMVIELYTADQLVPQGELFRAVQAGTIDAAQSDDDFDGGAGRRRGVRRLLPLRLALHARRAGAVELVRAEGDLGGGLCRDRGRHLARAPAPGTPATSPPPSRSAALADLKGLRVYTFPTGGRFLQRFGVVPVSLPYEDVEVGDADRRARRRLLVRHHRGLHGRLGRRDQVLPHQPDLRRLGRLLLRQHREVERACPSICKSCSGCRIDSSHYYRQHWYWGGEAQYRTTGGKLELTTIPDAEWETVEDAALEFWDEIAAAEPAQRQGRRRSSRTTPRRWRPPARPTATRGPDAARHGSGSRARQGLPCARERGRRSAARGPALRVRRRR